MQEVLDLLLALRGIVKQFPGVRALDGVDLEVRAGEVNGLLDQNGAGKSMLIEIPAGAPPATPSRKPGSPRLEVNGSLWSVAFDAGADPTPAFSAGPAVRRVLDAAERSARAESRWTPIES